MPRIFDRARAGRVSAGVLFGLTLSTAGNSPTLNVAPGFCADSTGLHRISLSAASARTTAIWTAGGPGGLDTGAIANQTWYHWYAVYNPATGESSICYSLSTAGPGGAPVAAGFTVFRRLGAWPTNTSGQWALIIQNEDRFAWSSPAQDVAQAAPTNISTLYSLSVPPGLKVEAQIRILFGSTAGGTILLVSSPNEAVQAANTPAGNTNARTDAAGTYSSANLSIETDTSRQIRVVAGATGSNQLWINTYGWIDTRGRAA